MVIGIAAAEGVKFDAVAGEGDFGSDEAQGPGGIDEELMAEDQGIAAGIGPAEVDELALGWGFGLEAESIGPREPGRSALDALGAAHAECAHVGG